MTRSSLAAQRCLLLGEDGASLKQQLNCADQCGLQSDSGLEGIATADRESVLECNF